MTGGPGLFVIVLTGVTAWPLATYNSDVAAGDAVPAGVARTITIAQGPAGTGMGRPAVFVAAEIGVTSLLLAT